MELTIDRLRQDLDDIDAQLVEVVGRRFGVCREIARVKQDQAIPMMQTDRIRFVKQRTAALAAKHGVAVEFVERLYDLIIDEACRIETDIIEQPRPL
jgi:chorismate mutase